MLELGRQHDKFQMFHLDRNLLAPENFTQRNTIFTAAAFGLLFMHLPILLIFVYAFTTEDKSYQWPPPGFTLKWFGVTWNRPDVWEALSLSLRVAAISTVIAMVLGTLCAAAMTTATVAFVMAQQQQ